MAGAGVTVALTGVEVSVADTGVVGIGVVGGVGVVAGTVNWALQTGPAGIFVHGTLGITRFWYGKIIFGHQIPFVFAIAQGETRYARPIQ